MNPTSHQLAIYERIFVFNTVRKTIVAISDFWVLTQDLLQFSVINHRDFDQWIQMEKISFLVPMIFISMKNRVIEIQNAVDGAPIKLTVTRPPAPCLCLEAKAAILIPGFPSLLWPTRQILISSQDLSPVYAITNKPFQRIVFTNKF